MRAPGLIYLPVANLYALDIQALSLYHQKTNYLDPDEILPQIPAEKHFLDHDIYIFNMT